MGTQAEEFKRALLHDAEMMCLWLANLRRLGVISQEKLNDLTKRISLIMSDVGLGAEFKKEIELMKERVRFG